MKVELLDGRTVQIDSDRITYEREIDVILPLSDRFLVLFDVFEFSESDPDAGRNLFAYDSTGKQLWRVQDAKMKRRGRTVEKLSQGYTGLRQGKDGTIYAWVMDWRYELDPNTGKISNPKYFR